MAYLERDGEKIQLFPRGELNQYLDLKKIKKLGVIPFEPSIGMSSEAGIPYVESEDGENSAFAEIAKELKAKLEL